MQKSGVEILIAYNLLCQEICALLLCDPHSLGVGGSVLTWHCRLVVALEFKMGVGTTLNLFPYWCRSLLQLFLVWQGLK